MIFINPDSLNIPSAREAAMIALSATLAGKTPAERSQFIEANRDGTWGHNEVLTALRAIAGNKCWYSEVHLEGADPNVDHFRPKGRVREIDADLKNTGAPCDGYWWLAFEPRNFRLACMHSNQRRTDPDTEGGKWDYFPIRGARTPAGTEWGAIIEDILALDPCSFSDVRLLWFDPDGKPCAAKWKHRDTDTKELVRVKATVWLYHLDKKELQGRRSAHVQDIRKDLKKAHTEYQLWAPGTGNPNLQAKGSFDEKVAEIKTKIEDNAEFAGAKRCAIRTAIADYPWIDEFQII
jgi:hypothetical protein